MVWDYMVRRGYMEGVGNNLFAVNGTMTRGQMVTILYRIAGKPTVEGLENPFKDVADGKFYTDAVIWAAENGIVEGNGDGTFNPNGFITRQQVAVILYRYSGEEAVSEDMLSSYPDGSKVANYAREAMNWAVAKGLIQGVANGETATLNLPLRQPVARWLPFSCATWSAEKRLGRPASGRVCWKKIHYVRPQATVIPCNHLSNGGAKLKKSFFKRVMSSVCATAMLFGTVAGVTKPVSGCRSHVGLLAGTPGNFQRVLLPKSNPAALWRLLPDRRAEELEPRQ
ncbi:MAG: S-layer homology domain-containing protein [Oscillospiraceae bacterium]